jgi:DNA-binding MarR family transcriptional regulator/GNAT superfamily N-acetyltransferase
MSQLSLLTFNEAVVNEGHSKSSHLVPALRTSARLLVREFGFMSSTFAETGMSPSAVHALVEIGLENKTIDEQGNMVGVSASGLCTELNLEKSSVSRMLKKLIKAGEIEEQASGNDARLKSLALTVKGKQTLAMINEISDAQIQKALERLEGGATAKIVLKGVNLYANALRSARLGGNESPEGIARITAGYQSSLAARVIEMHMEYYSRAVDFSAIFIDLQAQIATGLGDLIPRLDGIKAQVWTAMVEKEIIGCVFIDTNLKDSGTQDATRTAHFRYFLVDGIVSGKGVGKMLVEAAMKWVDERGLECQLWTFKSLVHARKLYDRAGFHLVEEGNSIKLGNEFFIQRLVRPPRTVPLRSAP